MCDDKTLLLFQVSFTECSDGLLILCDDKTRVKDARLVLRKAIESDGILYQTYQAPATSVVMSQRLVKEINAIAKHFEVWVS